MKHMIILGDGMADWPIKALGNRTLLQAAETPYMDKLARMGRVGRLATVAEGFHPGSEVANMSVLGYNLPKVYEGRGSARSGKYRYRFAARRDGDALQPCLHSGRPYKEPFGRTHLYRRGGCAGEIPAGTVGR